VILALETSCDDTCAAVVDHHGQALANVVSSQGIHDRFGGVVPEIASRHHLELVNLAVAQALADAGAGLDDVDLVAVTRGPGLVGALLVGFATAKALAAGRRLPLAPVDHLQGHVAANFLAPDPLTPPFLCLIASGGHTLLAQVTDHTGFEVLGRTLDDAAGEAFDKGARMLGLGYPGGPALERLAAAGDPDAYTFPGAREARGGRGGGSRPFAQSLDFSFAGLKTALLYKCKELGRQETDRRRADLAASYQRAIVEGLAARVQRALDTTNGAVRRRLAAVGVPMHVPAPKLCTDNAAMIASAARFGERLEYPDYLGLDVYATGERPL
jgi:N6-L-threonylcarbamoyladenine synthase